MRTPGLILPDRAAGLDCGAESTWVGSSSFISPSPLLASELVLIAGAGDGVAICSVEYEPEPGRICRASRDSDSS